jgi:hypothetical protein
VVVGNVQQAARQRTAVTTRLSSRFIQFEQLVDNDKQHGENVLNFGHHWTPALIA